MFSCFHLFCGLFSLLDVIRNLTNYFLEAGICKVVLDELSKGRLLSEVPVMSFMEIFPVCVIVVDLGVPVPVFFTSKPLKKQHIIIFK